MKTKTRLEHDSLGSCAVPSHAYYGIQTLRALHNFPLSGINLRHFTHFIRAFALVKKAAALANVQSNVVAEDKGRAIVQACDEILSGKMHRHFVVDMFQGGAGTSTNMNFNEVIANRGLEILGHQRGEYQFLHPNDDVNRSQSTNDAYPTAIKIGVFEALRETLVDLEKLQSALRKKATEFASVIKMGRTENQDAVPMTLGQEFGAYASMVTHGIRALQHASEELLVINMGATAIGTGINAPSGYAKQVTRILASISGLPVVTAEDLVEATQDSASFCQVSSTMKRVGVQVSKICNDLRWLSSGPRCGLNEINLPPRQPGSSIMPGKVNPVIPEAVNQICYQLFGFDATVSMAAEASELELNMAEPVIALNLFMGATLLGNAARILADFCIDGISANAARCRSYVENSIGLVTALNPILGYERSVIIAKEALEQGRSVYELVLEKGWINSEQLSELLTPERMLRQ